MLQKLSLKNAIFFITVTAIFLALWILRSFIVFEYLGVETLDIITSSQRWYLTLTKFLWVVLAVGFSILLFGKKWKQGSYLTRVNFRNPSGIIFALIPVVYVALFLIYSEDPSLSIEIMPILLLLPSVIYEESLFRGFLLPWLSKYMNLHLANIIQVFIFLLTHYCWWYFDSIYNERINFSSSIYIFAVGLFWGYASTKFKSMYPAIISHYLHNVLLSI
jgi:membrane protease YdiL (CAAX protease family)